jgi:proteasome accessory factor B
MAGRKRGGYSQTARALKILDRLTGRRLGVALAALADELEVTERQVRRDLAALEEAGHDVELVKRDDRAAARLVNTTGRSVFVTRRERYTLFSIRRVFDILRDTPFFEDVNSIYDKLTDGLSPDDQAELTRFGERFAFVPDGGRKAYGGKEDVLDAFQTGVLNRTQVRFRYRSAARKVTTGVLAPYTIALYKNGLYVVGHSLAPDAATPPDDLPRVYALERFLDAAVVKGARFEVPPGLVLAELFEGSFGIFLNGPRVRVTIDFSADLADRISARTWHPTQTLTRLSTGGLRLQMDVANTPEVIPWVLSFGPHANLLEPRDLAEKVASEHCRAADLYLTATRPVRTR